MTTLILAVSLAVAISAFCSLLESVLYSTRLVTVEASRAEGVGAARLMHWLKSHVERPLAAILILNTLANTAGAALAGWAAGGVWGSRWLWLFSLAFTMIILVFSEIIPKTVGAVHWRVLWRPSAWPLMLMVRLMVPLVWLSQALTSAITSRSSRQAAVSEDEILAAARLGAREGQISEMERGLIHNIIQLEETRAAEIMTPRTVILAQDLAEALEEVRLSAINWPHTRVPVFRQSVDHIEGFVLKDEVVKSDPAGTWQDLVHPVRFVPASADALTLLGSFLHRKEHIYMVVDEYGGIMGLVTLEDVLETLVGSEIVDENDEAIDLQDLARRRAKTRLAAESEEPS